ncbi:aspartate-semialdehyde dehydrogenase [Candidatus Bathyarchaeota archaeon]|nr:aspartate-semialdehyde dehydrogenase [Candidatus Bathyarchaeota archaeon]
MKKLDVIVLGATGAAGQNVVESLQNHPWFNLVALGASSRSAGKTYQEAIAGAVFFDKTPAEDVLKMKVLDINKIDPEDYGVAFSALPSDVAKIIEGKYAKKIPVFSTASAYRYEKDVPILIPDVNPSHAKIVKKQQENRGWEGFICPGPNCTTVGLVTSLKPIIDNFGIRSLHMVSSQSLSGAGEKGLRSDSEYRKSVEMNVLPYIEGEEEKVVEETQKILGKYQKNNINPLNIKIGVTCTRVYVNRVHLESVFLETKKENDISEVKKIMNNYISEPQKLQLPSAPEKPIILFEDNLLPQPKLHYKYGGQVTLVGRLRKDPVFKNGLSYVVTSDNLDKGAGGGIVLSAEFLKKKRYF